MSLGSFLYLDIEEGRERDAVAVSRPG